MEKRMSTKDWHESLWKAMKKLKFLFILCFLLTFALKILIWLFYETNMNWICTVSKWLKISTQYRSISRLDKYYVQSCIPLPSFRIEIEISILINLLCQQDPPKIFLNSPTSGSSSNTVTPVVYPLTSPQHHHSSPAFLSRFPRSLSSLSLGTRKKTEKDIPSPLSNIVQQSPDQLATPSLLHHHHQQTTSQQQQSMLHNATPSKRKFIGSEKNLN